MAQVEMCRKNLWCYAKDRALFIFICW